MSNNIIFEYGRVNDFVFSTYDIFTILEDDFKGPMLKPVGTATINTKQSYRPKIKVEFSSNIHFMSLNEGASIQLEFILTRKSEGFDEVVLGNRLYEIINSKSSFSQSYNFTYHDKNLPKGSHIYSIKVIPIFVECSRIVITNCNISLMAFSDNEYRIKVNNKDKALFLEQDTLNEEICDMISKVQDDSRMVVKEIEELKRIINK